jgi:hypothetical protein
MSPEWTKRGFVLVLTNTIKTMTIYQIKELTQETAPYYFDKKTLDFFGQTMRSFKVSKQEDGRYKISAPMKSYWDTHIGESVRFFNPLTNELELK